MGPRSHSWVGPQDGLDRPPNASLVGQDGQGLGITLRRPATIGWPWRRLCRCIGPIDACNCVASAAPRRWQGSADGVAKTVACQIRTADPCWIMPSGITTNRSVVNPRLAMSASHDQIRKDISA